MTKEISLLGIDEERVERSRLRLTEYVDQENIPGFIDLVFVRIEIEHPLLHNELTQIEKLARDVFFYRIGAALTYDMLPDRHHVEPLNLDQVGIIGGNMLESLESVDERLVIIDFGWFGDKLSVDSPDFEEFVVDLSGGMEDPRSGEDFQKGAFCVAMPFYMREEAKNLGKRFLV